MAKEQTIHLGYEVGTGQPVAVPLRHMAVTGQTQQSGKTTTLEALIARSGGTALTFVTKRGEGSFSGARRIKPYFRDRADWQFVTSILDATLQEKNKFLRPWIIRICRSTKSLKDVQEAVRDALLTAKGINAGVYTQLDAYLELIVPEIERADLADTLDLQPGINVMDVSDFATPMQMLFIQSALDFVNERCRHTTVVIPEAWEFVPQSKSSPVKASAETLVRKGAGIGNHIWLDSQDMAGVDNLMLRACTVWLIGVQREANEIKRNLANIPAGMKRPRPDEIASLERGQFYACFGKTTVKVYVQPAWMDEETARLIAMGGVSIDDFAAGRVGVTQSGRVLQLAPSASQQKEDEVDAATARALTEENERLKAELAGAEQRGYERGTEFTLRQAGEFWNAAALDLRDAATKVVEQGEYLALMAREGRWSLPRPAEQPSGKNELCAVLDGLDKLRDRHGGRANGDLAAPAAKPDPGQPDLTMLAPLVRSHPQALSPREWGLFLGLSEGTTKSGPWHRKVRNLTEAGYLEKVDRGFKATVTGIAAVSLKPASPADRVALWRLWSKEIVNEVGDAAIALLRVLAQHRRHRLTNEQLALLAGKSAGTAKSGPWFTSLKALREWELIGDDRAIAITDMGRAIIPEGTTAPYTDTAEQLRIARYERLVNSKRHYDALDRPMSKAELGQVLGVSAGTMKSGPWHGAIKEMIESRLVEEHGGQLRRRTEELAS